LRRIFERIETLGLKVICATNNSTSTPAQFADRIASLGGDLPAKSILNSAVASALYLKKIHPDGGPVYLVGENGLISAMEEQGFRHSDQDPLAVVAGMDRKFSYEKMARATHWIRSGVPFNGTNGDNPSPFPMGCPMRRFDSGGHRGGQWSRTADHR